MHWEGLAPIVHSSVSYPWHPSRCSKMSICLGTCQSSSFCPTWAIPRYCNPCLLRLVSCWDDHPRVSVRLSVYTLECGSYVCSVELITLGCRYVSLCTLSSVVLSMYSWVQIYSLSIYLSFVCVCCEITMKIYFFLFLFLCIDVDLLLGLACCSCASALVRLPSVERWTSSEVVSGGHSCPSSLILVTGTVFVRDDFCSLLWSSIVLWYRLLLV